MHKDYKQYYVMASMAISFAVHVLLYCFADRISFASSPKSDRNENQIMRVRKIELETEPEPVVSEKRSLNRIKDKAEKVRTLFKDAGLIKAPALKPRITGVGRNILIPKKILNKTPLLARPVLSPSIIEIDKKSLPIKRLKERTFKPKLARLEISKSHLPSTVGSSPVSSSLPAEVGLNLRLRQIPVNLNPINGSMKSLPSIGPPVDISSSPLTPNVYKDPKYQEPGILDSMLSVTPVVYLDQKEGVGYYQLKIAPNSKGNRLKAIPKDILFIVDCSNSINSAKLAEFVRGISSALLVLNPADRFNVVSFKTKPLSCFSTYVIASKGNVQQGIRFLKKLSSSGKTDVYAGLAPYVSGVQRTAGRPMLLFLVTDGKSTVRDGLKDSSFIQKISRNNTAGLSIFAFGSGDSVNTFLLDLLTYKNFGESMIRKKVSGSHLFLNSSIAAVSQILVSDLEFHIPGSAGVNVFPKKLPHLYRGHTLTIYGTFPLDMNEVNIQLLGNSINNREELIYKLKMSDAAQGDRLLARNWAVQKIYHLIGQFTEVPSMKIINEVKQLQSRFGISIPYTLTLEKKN